MAQVITTTNAEGEAIFHTQTGTLKTNPIPLGTSTLIYSSHSQPPTISPVEKDLTRYIHDRSTGFGPGVPCPPNGSSVSIIELAPGLASPMRALNTLGVFYLLEGEVRLVLDGGEERVLMKGDSGVLRGGGHSWRNDADAPARMIAFSQGLGDGAGSE